MRWRRNRRAFTLIEVLLAIALTSVVMLLLTTAIDLFMVRMETSRGSVESAQLARTILDQMAADLANTRLYAPPRNPAGAGAGGGQTSGSQNSGNQNSSQSSGTGGASSGPSSGTNSTSSPALAASDVNGLYGTVEEMRIDRGAYSNWERATREVDPEETASIADMPLSVRYYLQDGDFFTSERMARRGTVEEETSDKVAGLYRMSIPTAALADEEDPLASPTQSDAGKAELVAPEVVKLELAYFNGDELVKEWDSFDEEGLPAGVEIRLTLYEPSARTLDDPERADRVESGRVSEEDMVEYRRFVRIPNISPQQAADLLLPAQDEGEGEQAGGAQQGGAAGQGSGQNGGQQNGGQNSGQQGSNGNSN